MYGGCPGRSECWVQYTVHHTAHAASDLLLYLRYNTHNATLYLSDYDYEDDGQRRLSASFTMTSVDNGTLFNLVCMLDCAL